MLKMGFYLTMIWPRRLTVEVVRGGRSVEAAVAPGDVAALGLDEPQVAGAVLHEGDQEQPGPGLKAVMTFFQNRPVAKSMESHSLESLWKKSNTCFSPTLWWFYLANVPRRTVLAHYYLGSTKPIYECSEPKQIKEGGAWEWTRSL